MKKLKAMARVFIFDMECPHCGEPYANPDNGSFQWSIMESVPAELTCHHCGNVSHPPKKVRGSDITIRGSNE